MRLVTARALAGTYFVAMALAVTWPGMVPFSRVEPRVLGLPFGFFWIIAWVALSVPVLWALERIEGRHRNRGAR